MEQKPKLFNINNFITSESGRLTSLSLKRDLSLGGSKQKKIYTPNLNVVRCKNKGRTPIIHKASDNHKKNLKYPAAKSNQAQRYIQSTSVFSEGAGELRRPKTHSDRHLNTGERDPATLAIPKVIKTNLEVRCKEENTVVDDLLTCDDESSSESDNDYNPIILPLKSNRGGFLKPYKIKKEDPDGADVKEEVANTVNLIHSKLRSRELPNNYEVPYSFQDNKFYDDNRQCLSLLKLPDSLPGKGYEEESAKIIDFDINQMVGGKIGKVLVRKSGKVQIQIGHMKYFLDTVEQNPFKEEIMFVPRDIKTSGFGSSLASLGPFDEKYILSPSWNLFDLEKAKRM